MKCIKQLTNDLYWVGVNDRRIALFENVYPVPKGVSYNSYLLLDEKNVLFDTVDAAFSHQLSENITAVLNGRPLDYLVVNHMEPDHCASIGDIVALYPNIKIVCSPKAAAMIGQFFEFEAQDRVTIVKEGDRLSVGAHELSFYMAPMVHWPEVMVTYESTEQILFSADAFGSFGAIDGNLFADETDFEGEWLCEARRYYTNIVGKYGAQVQSVLKKLAGLNVSMVCPLHSLVWRKNIDWLIEKYRMWSSYTPEENSVVLAYASVYGHTENTVNILAMKLAERGIKHLSIFDVSRTHPSYIVSEAFRCRGLVLASITYNNGIFCNMEALIHDLAAHNLQNRAIALVENGTWSPVSAKLMAECLSNLKNNVILETGLSIKSALKPNQESEIDALADAIADALR